MKKLISFFLSLLIVTSMILFQVSGEEKSVTIDPILKTDRYASKDYEVATTNSIRYTEIETGNGKTYYINATVGNDSTGIGTSEKPFKTIERAMIELSEGDTIVLQEGIYQEKIFAENLKGTKQNPITIMGEKNSDVVVTNYDPVNTD